ncbi:MAG: DUF2970 domain-containing protein [Betaproteobacteria bacterium]|jgi:Protein of unknown function (DUF2970)
MNLFKAIGQSTLWRTIVAVSWSFVGIRKGSDFKEDMVRITPLHILVVGVVACFLFVALLIVIVNVVVTK